MKYKENTHIIVWLDKSHFNERDRKGRATNWLVFKAFKLFKKNQWYS